MNISVNFSSEIKAAKEKKVLNKPFRTPKGPKKFSVYVKNDKGNVVKVNFGDPNMEIKRDDPARRKSFRARHKCDTNPGPRWKAKYWSCKMWQSKKSVSDMTSKGSVEEIIHQWDGITFWNQADLLQVVPGLAEVEEINDNEDPTSEVENETENNGEQENEHKDEAIEMALGQLAYVAEHSKDLIEKIKADPSLCEEIEPWALSKITLMEDYMFSVYNYIVYSKESEIEASSEIKAGMKVLNINASCKHYGSEGIVKEIKDLPDNMGKVVVYEVENEASEYKKGDILTKTIDQIQLLESSK